MLNAESQAANLKKKGKEKEKESQDKITGGAGLTTDASTISAGNQNPNAAMQSTDMTNTGANSKLDSTLTKEQLEASLNQNVFAAATYDEEGHLLEGETEVSRDSELQKNRRDRIMRDKVWKFFYNLLGERRCFSTTFAPLFKK